jgi:hypothetical protein
MKTVIERILRDGINEVVLDWLQNGIEESPHNGAVVGDVFIGIAAFPEFAPGKVFGQGSNSDGDTGI